MVYQLRWQLQQNLRLWPTAGCLSTCRAPYNTWGFASPLSQAPIAQRFDFVGLPSTFGSMQVLSKAKAKLLRSLHQKKNRFAQRLFLVEGKKMVLEAAASGWKIELLVVREDVIEQLSQHIPMENALVTDPKTYAELSSQVNPEGVLACLHFPSDKQFLRQVNADALPELAGPVLLLDGIQDPGNLGTLLRTADWFRFAAVICSGTTADCFNPKVLRSSMGAIFRVPVFYLSDLVAFVAAIQDQVWLADMDGEAVDKTPLASRPYLLLGNEANGVSPALRALPGPRRLTIPGTGDSESLNVAVSGAILAWELRKAIPMQ